MSLNTDGALSVTTKNGVTTVTTMAARNARSRLTLTARCP